MSSIQNSKPPGMCRDSWNRFTSTARAFSARLGDRCVALLEGEEIRRDVESRSRSASSYSTVLQAEQALFPAELTLANIRASLLASSVNLYKAMGGGWVAIASDMTVSTDAPASVHRAE